MKFQKMIRVQMMLVGLGAGLLWARPVRAQQEVDPTFFEAASGASQLDQAAPLVAQEVNAAQLTSVDAKTIVVLMIGIGSIVLLGMADAVRGNRRRTWRESTPSAFPTGATAN